MKKPRQQSNGPTYLDVITLISATIDNESLLGALRRHDMPVAMALWLENFLRKSKGVLDAYNGVWEKIAQDHGIHIDEDGVAQDDQGAILGADELNPEFKAKVDELQAEQVQMPVLPARALYALDDFPELRKLVTTTGALSLLYPFLENGA